MPPRRKIGQFTKVAISALIGRGWFAVGVAIACIVSTVAGALTLLATMKLDS
jgi:hypothetical protein